MKRYFDLNGNEILVGDSIKLHNGSTEKVVLVSAGGKLDLGYDAVRASFRRKHPNYLDEYYSLENHVIRKNGNHLYILAYKI